MIKRTLVTLGGVLLGLTLSLAQATEVEYLHSGKILSPEYPFSEAVRVGDTVYLAGQVGNIPGTTDIAPGGMEAEARQMMENIKTSLEAHNLSMRNIVKCLVILTDMSQWGDFNKVYSSYFEAGRYPARSALGVSELAFGATVEAECTAVVGND